MAEAVFSHMVDEAGLSTAITVDSAGTGSWHVGERAHQGTRRVLQAHGISYDGRARQITAADLASGDTYVIAMSQSNVDELRRRLGDYEHVYRLLDFASQTDEADVPDPYYTGNFEYVYRLVEDGCRGLLEFIRAQEGL
jgi:protein-tyrosine phosphatase